MPQAIQQDDIQSAVLSDGGVTVRVLSLGCVTQDWRVETAEGERPVILGYRDPLDYLDNPHFMGIIAGRVANRIAAGKFTLNGQDYQVPATDGPNALHGGRLGLGRRNWTLETDEARAVRLTYRSPDGEEGFPGTVDFTVTISLSGHRLSYDMSGRPDRPTPISLAQHNYYTLGGPVGNQRLCLNADRYTPVSKALIPTGQLASVTGTRFDFSAPRALHWADGQGYDHNFVAPFGAGVTADLQGSKLRLSLRSNQPGLQVYTADNLASNQHNGPLSGVCLEPQGFPNAVNTPGFPSVICTPDRPYHQLIEIDILPI